MAAARETMEFAYEEKILFVPSGCTAELADGTEIKGPCFLVGDRKLTTL